MATPEIEDLRRLLDRVDEEILRLLDKRMDLCRRMGRVKRASGTLFVTDRERERRVIERAGPYGSIYRAIVKLCKQAQAGPPESESWFDVYAFYERLARAKPSIRLDAGDPDIPPPEPVLEALSRGLREPGGLSYAPSSGLLELRERIAEYHGVDVREVVVTPGSKAGLAGSLRGVDSVGVILPGWRGYLNIARLYDAYVETLHTDPGGGWKPSPSQLQGLASSVEAVVVNYPNNPTGAVLSGKEARGLVEIARDSGALLVSDEAYRDLVYTGERVSLAELEPEGVVSVYSFSKTFSLPGLRLGYVVGDPAVVGRVREFVASTYTSVPVYAQRAALVALDLLDRVAEERVRVYRGRLEAALRGIDRDVFEVVEPQGAFYLFPRMKCVEDSVDYTFKALERGVGIFPGAAFGGERYNRYIRVSLTRPVDEILQGLEILGELARCRG
ncbi:MAG: aminotransferase class I/II-fold pyridoxal phosphate-dependent enzyme [Desulfurococcales archaeon]|nr:aminotransferase class I/II-fold pyridoxal phosphate-dependent enzyme [Desulfurococcales archaeon]